MERERPEDALFDLSALHEALREKCEVESLSWAGLSRDIGVAASTIRRFATADDAEADGVLFAIQWLGVAPEAFVNGVAPTTGLLPERGVVRVDMDALRSTTAGADIRPDRARTTIQTLARVAAGEGRSIASMTRVLR